MAKEEHPQNPQVSLLLRRTKCSSHSSHHHLSTSLTFHLHRSAKQCALWAGKLCKQPSMRAAVRLSSPLISLSSYYAADLSAWPQSKRGLKTLGKCSCQTSGRIQSVSINMQIFPPSKICSSLRCATSASASYNPETS